MVYVAVVALSLLAANRVGNVVHTARDVDACLFSNLQPIAAVPACALELVTERGSSYSVLLGITNATRMSRQQNSPYTNVWCTLQASALQAYSQRSALSKAEQSLWITDSVFAEVTAAPTVCH